MSYRGSYSTAQAERDGGGMTVAPGDITGCYYILMAGLHKDIGWKQIKDFLRVDDGEPDHVEIFPESRTGWVRIYGRANYDAAMKRFRDGRCMNHMIVAAGSNATQPIYVRKLKVGLLDTTAATASTHAAAFSNQIPPPSMVEPSEYMAQNVAVSYANPAYATTPSYVTSPTTGYVVSPGYEQGPVENERHDVEYYKLHPTQGHHAPVVHKTGYEGNELYDASSRAFVDNAGSLSFRNPIDTDQTGADCKLRVQRQGQVPLTEEDVGHFIRSCAPVAAKHIVRIDIPVLGERTQVPLAIIKFDSAATCSLARAGIFDKEIDGIRMIQGLDTEEPEPTRDPAEGEESEDDSEDEHDSILAAAPNGPREHRTRKEQKRDRRKQRDANRKMGRMERAAAAGEDSGVSSSRRRGLPAPGAPGSSSSGVVVVDGTQPHHRHKPVRGVVVVDGTQPQHKHKPERNVVVVDGTQPHHKHNHHQKHHRK